MGKRPAVEEKLQAAEAALQGTELDDTKTRPSVQIAAIPRHMTSLSTKLEAVLTHSLRALDICLPIHLGACDRSLTLAAAYRFQETAQSSSSCRSHPLSQASGNSSRPSGDHRPGSCTESTTTGLAAHTYRLVLQWGRGITLQLSPNRNLGLARISTTEPSV